MKVKHVALQVAVALGLSLSMSAPAFAVEPVQYSANRISTTGRISRITRVGDQYRVTLDHGAYTYWVPAATAGNRDLRVGDRVRIDGMVTNGGVNANLIALSGEPTYANDPMYHGVPYGSAGWMSATVLNVNHRLNYMRVRDDATGMAYKIDLSHMNTLRPVNVWNARPGDHIAVRGSWEDNNLFRASRIEY